MHAKRTNSGPVLAKHHSSSRHFVSLRTLGYADETQSINRSNSVLDRLKDEKNSKMSNLDRRFSVAPMMDWTDRHCRYLHRLLTRRALLFTEMVTSAAIVHGDRERLLGFREVEHPVAVQLGGSDPAELAEATRIAEAFGYDEVNLNVGCPSDRVQSGRFGACLMAEPELVASCVRAMREVTHLPVTVKCRIGIDDQDTEESLDRFVDLMIGAGADHI
jgi:tRNA-dihydrouridine synthase A